MGESLISFLFWLSHWIIVARVHGGVLGRWRWASIWQLILARLWWGSVNCGENQGDICVLAVTCEK